MMGWGRAVDTQLVLVLLLLLLLLLHNPNRRRLRRLLHHHRPRVTMFPDHGLVKGILSKGQSMVLSRCYFVEEEKAMLNGDTT